MRTEFEELDVVQEKESDGYRDKFAMVMYGLILVTLIVGFIRWNVL
jgi:hypothetical protein